MAKVLSGTTNDRVKKKKKKKKIINVKDTAEINKNNSSMQHKNSFFKSMAKLKMLNLHTYIHTYSNING